MKNSTIQFFLFAVFVVAFTKINAQQVTSLKGTIKDNTGTTIPGASLQILNKNIFVSSNDKGYFEINYTNSFPDTLVISFVGMLSDTVIINSTEPLKIKLLSAVKLTEVVVVGSQSGFSMIKPMGTETIGNKELAKAACCNLSESFQNNASVDVNYSDAVSGAKQIQMLGLDGAYTQIQAENVPLIRGLNSAYGLGFVPGTWIESIQISKGAGSVANGYEALTGQINIEILKPEKSEKLFVNGYASHLGRYELNAHGAQKINNHVSTLLLAHGSTVVKRNDINKDGFMDFPLYHQINLYNRWQFHLENGIEGQVGIKALVDNKVGGQTNFNVAKDYLTTNAYGIGINSKAIEAYTKTGYVFKNKPYQSIGFINSFRHYKQNSFFGLRQYRGEQNNYYSNLIFQSIIGDTRHTYRTGLSFLSDNYSENLNDSLFNRNEIVPGAFYEYNYNDLNKWAVVAGLRADYHNLYGPFITPRLHAKYSFTKDIAFRVSGGRGFRVHNVYPEAQSILISSREIVILEKLNPEIAWNYGASLTIKLKLFTREASLNIDYFRTDFVNQIIVDTDLDVRKAYVYNLKGKSYSNAAQADFTFSPLKPFEVKLAYKKYDVKYTLHGNLMEKPLLVRDRGLIGISYSSKFDFWKIDLTAQFFGKARLPNTSSNPEMYRLASSSDPYYLLFGQVTRNFKHFGVYLGVENITNFMQHHAIVNSKNPFNDYFDASMIWGPIMGRVVYGGFRFKINSSTN